MSEGVIVIKQGREKPIRNQHPWIFSGAIARVENAPSPGDIVTVLSQQGDYLARGYWNPKSQIQVRILTWKDEAIDEDWWWRTLQQALDGRIQSNNMHDAGNPVAYRVVNAENDYLPGLVVDRYGNWVVLQALTLGIDSRKDLIADILSTMLKPSGIYERSDVDARGKEGLSPSIGVLWGEKLPDLVEIDEMGLKVLVDLRNGHKTGYYLDQAANRHALFNLLSEEIKGHCRLLNLFSYTGGFGLHALDAGGIHAVNVDSSVEALELAEKNAELNGFHRDEHGQTYEHIQADVFQYLRDVSGQGEQYDVVILDPPKFAHNKQQVTKASRGYKDINLKAFRVVKSGGYVMTFSCSGAINAQLFQQIVFGALADSGRQAQVVRHLGPGSDHPVALTFPEGAYLKGLLLRVY